MSIDTLKNIVSKAAPILGNLLSGSTAGIALNLISSVFGGDSKPDDLLKKIVNDPESAIKLAQIQADNIVKLKELELDHQQMYFDDTADARKLASNMAASGNRDYTPSILAILFTIGFFAMIVIQFIFPDMKNDTITMGLVGAETLILGYYFGSSFKSDKKG